MRNSQFSILIANLFIIGSFLNDHFLTSVFMILCAFLWLFKSIMDITFETRIARFEAEHLSKEEFAKIKRKVKRKLRRSKHVRK